MGRLITVNANKSTTLGGVETLIRHLQSLHGGDCVELYENEGTKEYFPPKAGCVAISYGKKGRLAKVKTKFRQILALRQLRLKNDDVVVFFHPNDILYAPFKALKSCKVIVVQTNDLDLYFKPFSKMIWKFLSRRVDFFTVYTDMDRDYAEKFKFLSGVEIKVIPRACRLSTASELPLYSKKIVTIARIDEGQKNFSGMLDVMERLPTDITLDIYGGGKEEEVEGLLERVSKHPNVNYMGVATNLEEIFSKYSAFIMTSRYEGFGQTLIEARSQGLPCLAYNSFLSAPWVVKNNVTGFLIPYGDVEGFSSNLEKLLEDAELFKAMAANCLRFAVETESEFVDQKWNKIIR